ncbi:MAG TPA: NADPH-dependent ferric siderophore reductase, partial [Micromonosporaceae bacterium]|nr:NADPH-dependent ferric siderophore reductase [Micromonosporaceae bacterium]
KLVLLGPDARYEGSHGGVEFHPPVSAQKVLLAGDETAVPAIASILERMPEGLQGEAILEVPHADDVLTLQAPPGMRLVWRKRNGAPHGSLLEPVVKAAAARLLPAQAGEPVQDVDVDNQILWEVPQEPAPASGVYAWLAGEAGVIRTLRRHLITEQGLDRRSVAFMGYWRLGRADNID